MLYKIHQQHQALLQQLEDNDGELTPELEQALGLTLEGLKDNATSIGYSIKQLEDKALLADNEIKRLEGIKKRAESSAAWMKGNLANAMLRFDVKCIEKDNLKLSFRKSQTVEINDLDTVPDEFKKEVTTVTPDKKAIKAAFAKGEIVPGAEVVERQNLQIK